MAMNQNLSQRKLLLSVCFSIENLSLCTLLVTISPVSLAPNIVRSKISSRLDYLRL